MKKIVLIFLMVMSIILLIIVLNQNKIDVDKIPRIELEPSHAIYTNEMDMYKNTDLIVLGSVETTLDQDKKSFKRLESDNLLNDITTVTPFRIDAVLYGSFDKKYLNINQPIAIRKNGRGDTYKYTIKDYRELDRKNTYILYLKKLSEEATAIIGDDTYSILGIYHGMINLNEDYNTVESDFLFINRMKNIKAGVLERFEDELIIQKSLQEYRQRISYIKFHLYIALLLTLSTYLYFYYYKLMSRCLQKQHYVLINNIKRFIKNRIEFIFILTLIINISLLTVLIIEKINIPIMFMDLNDIIYENEAELAEKTELIVLGSVETTLEQDKSYTKRIIPSTFSPFRVDKVLYGSFDKEYLNVIQPTATGENPSGDIVKYTVKGYMTLDKRNIYILYLRKTEDSYIKMYEEDTYFITGYYYGMINLSMDIYPYGADESYKKRVDNIKDGVLIRFSEELIS